jgi:hypothetical protein
VGRTRHLDVIASDDLHDAIKLPAAVAAQADQTQYIKRAALIRRYEAEWRTIETDLRHADENGLAAVAKGTKHGMWDEHAALRWAGQNGKTRHATAAPGTAQTPWLGQVHRIEG